MHAFFMLPLLLACNAPSPDSGHTGETGRLGGAWAALASKPSWESVDEGYGTGAGFADFDGDGDADLIVAYGNDIRPGPISIYLNDNGILSDEAVWSSSEFHYYAHLAIGDVDGDGDPDVAVSRFLGDQGFDEPGGVEIWLNEGGALMPGWSEQGFHSFSCVLGDIDRDGDLDLVAAAGEPYHNDAQGNRAWLNDGAGQFSPLWIDDATWTMDVGLVDVDGDGWLDVAAANWGSPHTVHRFDGQDFSLYWTAEGSPERFEGNTLDWADVNGDDAMDLVISDNLQLGGEGTISLYCGPTLERCWESTDPPRYQSAVSLEDVDGDGWVDLAAGAWGRGNFAGDVIRIYRNVDGTLEDQASWTSNSQGVAEAIVWADLDRRDAPTWSIDHPGGLTVLPQGTEIAALSSGQVSDGRHVTGAPGTIVVDQPTPRDLAVSNWNKTVGNFLFSRTP